MSKIQPISEQGQRDHHSPSHQNNQKEKREGEESFAQHLTEETKQAICYSKPKPRDKDQFDQSSQPHPRDPKYGYQNLPQLQAQILKGSLKPSKKKRSSLDAGPFF